MLPSSQLTPAPPRLSSICVDLDAGAAVDGDVGGDRELAAGEDNPAALHLGREVDPVGGGGIGVGER